MNYVHMPGNLDAIVDEDSSHRPFYINEIGHSSPPAGSEYHNILSPVYAIHFVVAGRGTYNFQNIDNTKGFLIVPAEPYHFVFDKTDPWEHYWIGLHGRLAGSTLSELGMPTKNHVFDCDWFDEFIPEFRRMIFKNHGRSDPRLLMLSLFYRVMAAYSGHKTTRAAENRPDRYAIAAKRFIETSYADDLSVADIARYVSVSPKYLEKLFRQKFGVAPKTYIAETRIRAAKLLLESTELSVTEIAHSVGFAEQTYFSNVFRESVGLSPSAYRKVRNVNNV